MTYAIKESILGDVDRSILLSSWGGPNLPARYRGFYLFQWIYCWL